jgi:hypothetical protein
MLNEIAIAVIVVCVAFAVWYVVWRIRDVRRRRGLD